VRDEEPERFGRLSTTMMKKGVEDCLASESPHDEEDNLVLEWMRA
jgi:hypothetical protein